MTHPLLLYYEALAMRDLVSDPESFARLRSGATASAVTLRPKESTPQHHTCPTCGSRVMKIKSHREPNIMDTF